MMFNKILQVNYFTLIIIPYLDWQFKLVDDTH
jgi:hypothetical protein